MPTVTLNLNQGAQGATGPQGPQGATGPQGAKGDSPSPSWFFDNQVTNPTFPRAYTRIGFDTSNIINATKFFINHYSLAEDNFTSWLASWDDNINSTNEIGTLSLSNGTDTIVYKLSNLESQLGSSFTLTSVFDATFQGGSSNSWTHGDSIYVSFSKIGKEGADGATGPQGIQGEIGATGATGPGVAAGGTTGQALVKIDGTDYNTQWADIAVDVQYHNRYATTAETLRSGATETLELYFFAQADGNGLAESAQSDTATTGYDIRRKLYYSEAAQADPDTGTWVQFADIADDTTFASAKATLLAYLKERTGGTVPISLKMTWEEVAEAPSFTGLLNESYGSGAAAAYSVRRLNGNYTGAAVQLERSSDNSFQDIGFDVNGDLDESAITTFCTGTTCKVRTWYDQSGNAKDLSQTLHARQPKIYDPSAGIEKLNNVPFLNFEGTPFMAAATASDWNFLHDGTTNSVAFVAKFGADASDTALHPVFATTNTGAGSAGMAVFSNNSAYRAQVRNLVDASVAVNASPIVFEGNQELYFQVVDADNATAGDRAFAYKDGGTDFANNTQSSAPYAGDADEPLQLGAFVNQAGNYYLKGGAQEIIFYASDKSTDRTLIESNIGDYFTQNTPLLDTYTGAAAAYSLRKLRSAYSGSAIRVRRASDNTEQDIGFNVFGELDTVSLASFCSGTNGFVAKWYDQSGNANDATQTTTANQPKIYDSTTGYLGYLDLLDAGDSLSLASTITTGEVTIFSALNPASGGMLVNDGLADYLWYRNGTSIRWNTSAGTFTITATPTYGSLSLDVWDYSGTAVNVRQNTSSIGSGAVTGNVVISTIGDASSGGYLVNNYRELIIYTSQQSAGNITNIESNINTFYSIY